MPRPITPELIARLRCADPTARQMVEAHVLENNTDGTPREHVRNTKAEWVEMDWATGATITASGMTSFDSTKVANAVYGDTAWSTDSAVPGAYVQIDLGAGGAKAFCSCAIWAAAVGHKGDYAIEHSDNASAWTLIATIQPNLGLSEGPGQKVDSGPNYQSWDLTAGNGLADAAGNEIPHRYWRLRLTNTPGASPVISELAFQEVKLLDNGDRRIAS